jgi:lipocalin
MYPANIASPVVCDPIVPLTNFSVANFAGTWYEQVHVMDPNEPPSYQCETAQYTDLADDPEDPNTKHFKVYNSFQSKVLGVWAPRIGVHANAKCGTDGACYVSFFGKAVPEPNLHILDTDYDTYTINYQCDTERNMVYFWINTREPVVTDEFYNELYAKAMAMLPNFDESTLEPRITQGDMCSYHKLSGNQTNVSAIADFLTAHRF